MKSRRKLKQELEDERINANFWKGLHDQLASERFDTFTPEEHELIFRLAASASSWMDHYAEQVQIDNRADLLRIACYEAERDRFDKLAASAVASVSVDGPDFLTAITHGELS